MAASLQDAGIGAYGIAVRLFETADRLRDLADQAEESNKLADATRATLAEGKTLHLLLSLGLQGPQQLDYARDAAALEGAVVALVRQTPLAGEIIAAELDRRDRAVLAGKVRRFAEKCRAVSENESR